MTPVKKPFWETIGVRQDELHKAILDKQVVFTVGPAGTGKTLVALYTALDLLFAPGSDFERIVVSRPLITVGEKMGTLPGDVSEKINPYLAPIWDLLRESNHPHQQTLSTPRNDDEAKLIGKAVNMMRGSTVREGIWILDEAQNLTKHELEMCLTRVGHNSKLIINGDPDQSDIKESGLLHAIDLMESDEAVGVVRFTVDDVQRSDFVGRVIRRYAEDRSKKTGRKSPAA